MNSHAIFKCPKCQTDVRFDARKLKYVQHRESELQAWEQRLRDLERRLGVRKTEHQGDVRLIRSCLHPDKHPEQAARYTRAWQAFERLLTSATKPNTDAFDDDIPF
jgi:hypothetical protein